MRRFLLSLAHLALRPRAAPQALTAEQFSGGAIGVTNGDAIKVLRDGRAERVRLCGSKFRRTVGGVILPDGRGLNRELVRAGLAPWFRRFAPENKIRISQVNFAFLLARGRFLSQNEYVIRPEMPSVGGTRWVKRKRASET